MLYDTIVIGAVSGAVQHRGGYVELGQLRAHSGFHVGAAPNGTLSGVNRRGWVHTGDLSRVRRDGARQLRSCSGPRGHAFPDR
jgi:hypothetical protein